MRILRILLLVVLLALVAVAGAGAYIYTSWTQGPLPQHEGEVSVAGLRDQVEIIREANGIAHIYATNTYDLFFAQGYTQAQDRWWQMEFFRRTGRGEIQELTGKRDSLMGTDIFIRTVGWLQAARSDLELLSDEARDVLQAFTDGVNAYISNRGAGQLAFEYNVLSVTGVNIPIKPWSIEDTLVWGKVMSWDLSGNYGTEAYLASLIEGLGEEMVADYIPEYPFDQKPTIIQREDLPESGESFEQKISSLATSLALGQLRDGGQLAGNFVDNGLIFARGNDIGSNNWVVAGAKTGSGMPLLANDPHLGIQMPSIWYEIGLHCQPVSEACPYNVRGFTFAATPGIIVGHNGTIGWGVTNVGWDTQDRYLITVNPENPLQYRWDGEWRDMTVREEVIRFGNSAEPVTIQVRETHLGPIVNDNRLGEDGNILGFNNEDPVALRWTALEPGTLFNAVVLLNQAKNFAEFREALRLWDTPSQNVVYADIEGNIGYQTPGRIPVRAPGHTGLLPVDGSSSEFEWRGFVPFENLPSVYNPARNYIATANQALVPFEYYEQLRDALTGEFGEDAHYPFGYLWSIGYRGERIVEMLEESDEHSIETFRSIQGDNKIIFAEELSSALREMVIDDAELTEIRDWLLDWDYQMHKDSPQAALWAHFWTALTYAVFEDQLGDLDEPSGNGYEMWAIRLLLDEPDNIWWDDASTADVREQRDDMLLKALRQGYDNVVEAQGSDRNAWAWGTLHTSTFVSNPLGLSGISIIEDIVNHGPIPTSGGSEIVNANSYDAAGGNFTVRAIASMRMILDFEDLDNSRTVHSTGQSGHPFSENYRDMNTDWQLIESHPMLFSRDKVEAAANRRLILNPAR